MGSRAHCHSGPEFFILKLEQPNYPMIQTNAKHLSVMIVKREK